MVADSHRDAPAPEGLSGWLDGIWEGWAEAWAARLPGEVRAFATVAEPTLGAQTRDHARALSYLWKDGDDAPLRAFYWGLVRDGRELGLGLPDLVGALILGRGLLRRLAREASGGGRSPWDEVLAESFDGALTLMVRCHEVAVEEAVRNEVEATEGRLLAILQGSTDGLVVLDPDGRVALWSRGASDLLGVHEGEAIGRPIGECMPREVVHELPGGASASGAVRRFEVRIPRERGAPRDLLVSRTQVGTPDGGTGWSSLIFKDVTEVKELQKELAQAEHLAGLGRLSASVAHEIKNPIAGLRGAMEVISQVHRSDDPRFIIFQEALSQIRRLDTLVKDLLTYAKPVTLSLEPVPVEFLVEAALPLVREQLREAKAELRTEISPGLPCALADPQHITQVFSNLIQNAAQAVPAGGTVTVSARDAGDEVAICVADDGPGISEADLPKVFQPFFTTKHIGTGLGLSIVQRILAAHGGRCEVGRGPDGGAAFTVYLRSGGSGAGNGTRRAGVGPDADAPGGTGHPGGE